MRAILALAAALDMSGCSTTAPVVPASRLTCAAQPLSSASKPDATQRRHPHYLRPGSRWRRLHVETRFGSPDFVSGELEWTATLSSAPRDQPRHGGDRRAADVHHLPRFHRHGHGIDHFWTEGPNERLTKLGEGVSAPISRSRSAHTMSVSATSTSQAWFPELDERPARSHGGEVRRARRRPTHGSEALF